MSNQKHQNALNMRLQMEIDNLSNSPPNIHLESITQNHWKGFAIGPRRLKSPRTSNRDAILDPIGSNYEDMIIPLEVDIPIDYPFKAPIIRFLEPDQIDHPMVKYSGGIVDLNYWAQVLNDLNFVSPVLHVVQYVLSIVALITSDQEFDEITLRLDI